MHALLHGGVTADAAVYLHPAESGIGMREVKALASGQLVFKIIIPGRLPPTNEPGHTAFAHLAINPTDKAMVVLAALRALDARRGARVHHPALEASLLDQCLLKFYWLREQPELRKKPSTSELIDWIAALGRAGMSSDTIEAHIPFIGSLLKTEQDSEALKRYAKQDGALPTSWAELGPRYNQ